jgi:hypothetical protein
MDSPIQMMIVVNFTIPICKLYPFTIRETIQNVIVTGEISPCRTTSLHLRTLLLLLRSLI